MTEPHSESGRVRGSILTTTSPDAAPTVHPPPNSLHTHTHTQMPTCTHTHTHTHTHTLNVVGLSWVTHLWGRTVADQINHIVRTSHQHRPAIVHCFHNMSNYTVDVAHTARSLLPVCHSLIVVPSQCTNGRVRTKRKVLIATRRSQK